MSLPHPLHLVRMQYFSSAIRTGLNLKTVYERLGLSLFTKTCHVTCSTSIRNSLKSAFLDSYLRVYMVNGHNQQKTRSE